MLSLFSFPLHIIAITLQLYDDAFLISNFLHKIEKKLVIEFGRKVSNFEKFSINISEALLFFVIAFLISSSVSSLLLMFGNILCNDYIYIGIFSISAEIFRLV